MTKLNQTLESLRGSYQDAKLDIEDCHSDPVKQFDQWFDHAVKSECDEPNAFVLSTVSRDLKPRARVVLLKGVHEGNFIFYTNYDSAKGLEVGSQQHVSLTFVWLPLARQVRIEGTITKVEDTLSDEYFHKRPRGSQLGAIASPQSRRISSRAELEKMFLDAEQRYQDAEKLPRPKNWGGYAVTPSYFEFWQGRKNRMHDRICYEQTSEGWQRFRIAP